MNNIKEQCDEINTICDSIIKDNEKQKVRTEEAVQTINEILANLNKRNQKEKTNAK